MHLMRSLILGLLAALIANVAVAATLPATAANLAAQLAAAHGGDTITVTGDLPARLVIRNVFDPPVTLDFTAATAEGGLYFNQAAGFEIRGGTWRPTSSTGAIYATASKHIHAAGLAVVSTPGSSYAFQCRGSADVSLVNSALTGAGAQVSGCQDVLIDGNAITGFSSDGTQIASSQRVTYTHNLCWAGVNDGVHHPDCFQVWSVAGQPQSADVTARFNQFNGATQGGDDFGGDDRGVLRLTIADNDYLGSYPQAFAVAKSAGAVVRGNRARTLPGATWRAAINLTAPAVDHCGNTADAYARWAAWADAACPAN